MSDLIEALTILLKYGDPDYPTHCEHDVLTICGIEVEHLTSKDIIKLSKLGFDVNYDEECLQSFRFGSA